MWNTRKSYECKNFKCRNAAMHWLPDIIFVGFDPVNSIIPEYIRPRSKVVRVFENYWPLVHVGPPKETDEFKIWLTDKLRKLVISHDFYFQIYSWEDHLRSISSLEKDWYE